MATSNRKRLSTRHSNPTDHLPADKRAGRRQSIAAAQSLPAESPAGNARPDRGRHESPPALAGKPNLRDHHAPAFHSILFETTQQSANNATDAPPAFFADLNLDQIIDAITAGREEYDLKPFFYAPLHSIETIRFRHEIMQDLQNGDLFDHIKSFARKIQEMRGHLAQADKLHYELQRQRWFLDAVAIYCDAVDRLGHDVSCSRIKSRGFTAFREYIADYIHSERFGSLMAETKRLAADLSALTYCLEIQGNRITVRNHEAEPDYSAEIEKTFEKFKQGAVNDYQAKFYDSPEMNHIEAKILDLVAQLYPDIFSNLDGYCGKNRDYMDATIAIFDREIQFYIAYLEHIAKIGRAGLRFCYPNVSSEHKEVCNEQGFDLALANKLVDDRLPVVCNDFYLKGKERVIVVSGPNQGGKTTFARTFGQVHYLAGLGCPVPGSKAQLFLCDQFFTHFEKEENIKNLRGKLQDDLVRIHDILTRATPDSMIIINEIFTSTALKDALFLSREVMEKIMHLDALCVCVTFIDELASLSEQTVSMVSTVVPENPALRTYKIVRRAADGFAYALSIAEKYEVTYQAIKERIRS